MVGFSMRRGPQTKRLLGKGRALEDGGYPHEKPEGEGGECLFTSLSTHLSIYFFIARLAAIILHRISPASISKSQMSSLRWQIFLNQRDPSVFEFLTMFAACMLGLVWFGLPCTVFTMSCIT